MTICANHRGKLGLGWTRCSTRCRIPAALSNHGEGSRKAWPKGDRGISKRDSETVLHMTGVFIQAGSGKMLYDLQVILMLIIYSEMILDCDWSISVELIPNRSAKVCSKSAKICNNSAKICNNSAKICNNSAKCCNNSAKLVMNLFDWLIQTPIKQCFFCCR